MKMNFYLTGILLFLLTGMTTPGHTACELFDLVVTKTPCSPDKKFAVKINFNYRETSDCFTVTGNGKNYGTFRYQNLPIVIDGLDGDCHTLYEFVIKDCHTESCSIAKELGKVCCESTECKISDLRLERTDCDSNRQFYVHLNFNHQNNSSCFKLKINDQFYKEYPYSALPIKIGPLEGDCLTERIFTITDCEKPDCMAKIVLEKICCGEPCKFSEIKMERTHCDSNRNVFVFLNFSARGVSDSFYIKGNSRVYGKFKYGTGPYKVGPIHADCSTLYGFAIIDHKEPHCATDTLFGKICCDSMPEPCKLYDLVVERTECTPDKQFYVHINFKYQNPSNCFKVVGNGREYGTFPYSSLPLKLGPFPGDCHTEYEFLIRDCEVPDCKLIKELGTVCCDTSGAACKLYDLKTEQTDCDANRQFYVFLNFKADHPSECFRVEGNGQRYGEFRYSSLPIKLGPFIGDCHTSYEFVIRDCEDPHCVLEKSIGIVCCEPQDCKLSELRIERTDCLGDKQFYALVNFKHQGTSECFRLKGNGKDYGEFRYSQLPLKIGPLLADCKTPYEFVALDCLKPDCRIAGNLGTVCCDSLHSSFTEVVMTRSECEKDSTFRVKFSFKYRNVSDSFHILVNGRRQYTFAYAQLPVSIGPLKADCKTIYKFNIIDQKDSTLRLERFLERPCCEPKPVLCQIGEIKVTPLHCDGPGTYSLMIQFRAQGITNRYFEVFDRNGPIGFFPFSQLPVTIDHFKKSGRQFDFLKICENDNPTCCKAVEFRSIDCATGNPEKFSLSRLYINHSTDAITIFSSSEIPPGLEIEMFDLAGRQIPVKEIHYLSHEISLSTEGLSSNMYFIRIKDQEDRKTFKFFHLR